MNIKKADWINPPEILERSLHSLTVKCDGKHTLLFTAGENDSVTLSVDTELDYGFMLLHTPEEYLLIGKEKALITFGGVRTAFPLRKCHDRLCFRKEGKRITVLSGDDTVLSIEKDAFLSSSSFGLTIEGEGNAYVEVF